MSIDRRHLLGGAAVLTLAGLTGLSTTAFAAPRIAPFTPTAGPRCRVMLVNDLSGDIDGLFGAVHAVLSPGAQLRGIVGTAADNPAETAAVSAAIAEEMLALMGLKGAVPVYAGAARKLAAAGTAVASAGSDAIIAEAMRDDTALPLFVTVGGGLTEVASALLKEPRIADRMTLVWIGGDLPEDWSKGETNFNIDALATLHVFNASGVRIWQVPRNVYKTCVISATELQAHVAPCGPVGKWLYEKVVDFPKRFGGRFNTGETWTLGDSPLVVFTALTDWVPSDYQSGVLKYERIGSSAYQDLPTPRFNPDGSVTPDPAGRPMRLFRSVDTRLMFGDFFAKLAVNFRV